MTLDAIVNLERIRYLSPGYGYPYIWPVMIWFDSAGSFSSTCKTNEPRLVLGGGFALGESIDIPASVGRFGVRFDETTERRFFLLVVALWSAKESPLKTVRMGCETFCGTVPDRVIAHAGELMNWENLNQEQQNQIIKQIKNEIFPIVRSSMKGSLSGWDKFQIGIGTLSLDDLVNTTHVIFDRSTLKQPEPPEASSSSMQVKLRFKDPSGSNNILYEIDGQLIVKHVQFDRCQPMVDKVINAQAAVRSLQDEIKYLEENPDNLPRRYIFQRLREITTEELPSAREALDAARKELQDCRDFQPVIGGRGIEPRGLNI